MKRLALAAVLALAACSTSQPADEAANESNVQDVSLQLPNLATSGVSATVASLLTSYRFTVTSLPQGNPASIPASCALKGSAAGTGNSTVLIGSYTSSATIGVKLQKSCLYDAKLEVGQYSQPVNGFTAYYLGDTQVDTSRATGGTMGITIQLAWNPLQPVTGGGVPPVIVASSNDVNLQVSVAFSPTSPGAVNAGGATAQALVSYTTNVKPIMDEYCVTCHTTGGKATPDLSSYGAMISGINGVITDVNSGRMPLGGSPLTAAQITTLSQWQAGGFQP